MRKHPTRPFGQHRKRRIESIFHQWLTVQQFMDAKKKDREDLDGMTESQEWELRAVHCTVRNKMLGEYEIEMKVGRKNDRHFTFKLLDHGGGVLTERGELCNVPVPDIRDLVNVLQSEREAFLNHIKRGWRLARVTSVHDSSLKRRWSEQELNDRMLEARKAQEEKLDRVI